MHKLYKSITESRLIAILRGVPNDLLCDTIHALTAGGIRFIELPFDQRNPPCAELAIQMAARMGTAIIGAGTVMTPEQVDMAANAGAQYIIAPNTDPAVIARAKERGLLTMPGAFTPTEVAAAYTAGADIVKIFPASSVGPTYLKALRGPYPHIPLAAVGGISASNARSFLDAGACAVCVGSKLADVSAIRSGRFDDLTAAAVEMVKAVR